MHYPLILYINFTNSHSSLFNKKKKKLKESQTFTNPMIQW